MAAGGFRVLAVAPLAAGGVTVKLLTVDNEFVRRKICQELAIDVGQVFVGDDIDRLDDAALTEAVGPAMLMARLTPNQKRRVIETLRRKGHVVGFLGDGVNDALALREADVGISFDSAVDLTRKSADCILLDKDLGVLLDGIREGRRVFVNVLKFQLWHHVQRARRQRDSPVRAHGPGSAPGQQSDLRSVAGADPDRRRRPGADRQATAHMPRFHTGWFVESLLTHALVIHVIRTDRILFLQSRASLPLFGRDDGGAGGNLVAGSRLGAGGSLRIRAAAGCLLAGAGGDGRGRSRGGPCGQDALHGPVGAGAATGVS